MSHDISLKIPILKCGPAKPAYNFEFSLYTQWSVEASVRNFSCNVFSDIHPPKAPQY